jgi:Flp pilus assembly protein CpaB
VSLSLHELQRFTRRHRAVVAGGLTVLAVLLALPALAPSTGPVVTVVAAARDLAPGSRLTHADLTTVSLPRRVAPDGALHDADALLGRSVTGAIRRGEALTDVRLLGAGLVQATGLVAAPVRVADAAAAALLHEGDHVDVLAAPTSSDAAATSAVTVAHGLQVLAVPETGSDADGGLVVLAATPATAARLAAAAVGARLSVTVLPAA